MDDVDAETSLQILQASPEKLERYTAFLKMPPSLADRYRAVPPLDWVRPSTFRNFLFQDKGVSSGTGAQPQPSRRRVRSPSIEILDDPPSPSPTEPRRKRQRIKPDPESAPTRGLKVEPVSDDDEIQILDGPPVKISGSTTSANTRPVPDLAPSVPPAPTPTPSGSTGPRTANQRRGKSGVYVTSKEHVQRVVYLKGMPARMPCEPDVCYVLDLTGVDVGKTRTGKDRTLASFFKAEDHDSWGRGTSGSSSSPVGFRAFQSGLTEPVQAVRSSAPCNGTLVCDLFDETLLTDYKRVAEDDMSLTQEIFKQRLSQSSADQSTVSSRTASFYRMVTTMKCKLDSCKGHADIRPLKDAPTVEGKHYFVGCSAWRRSERFDHLFVHIPTGIDESLLKAYFTGQKVPVSDETTKCHYMVHPRHGKEKKCPHIHYKDSKLYDAGVRNRPCEVTKSMYFSLDTSIRSVAVIFRNAHNHPPFPAEKLTQRARTDIKTCLDAMGSLSGATAGKLDSASTTQSAIGKRLSEAHPSLQNKRHLRTVVASHKQAANPAGLDWPGLMDLFIQEQKLPLEERYVHRVRFESNIKVAVCMVPYFAHLIHSARYIVNDYTFKRVHGDTNEWEVTIFDDATNERITCARVFCDSQSSEAFEIIWTEFFTTIKQISGKSFLFHVFNPDGSCRAVILDMEAAQVIGFGRSIIKLGMNDPVISKISTTSLDELVSYIIKLCSVHWDRSADTLATHLPAADVEFVKRIRGLDNDDDIQAWHSFCENHSSEHLRNWYEHKIRYTWLLPAFNSYLSLMPKENWDLTPSHTNIVESAHVATNLATGINLPLVEAINASRKYDFSVAADHKRHIEACVLPNHNNSEAKRMRRGIGRKTSRTNHVQSYATLEEEVTSLTEAVAVDVALKKQLRESKKALKTATGTAARLPLLQEVEITEKKLAGSELRSESLKAAKLELKEMGRRPRQLQRHPSAAESSDDDPIPVVGTRRRSAADLADLSPEHEDTMVPGPAEDERTAPSTTSMFDFMADPRLSPFDTESFGMLPDNDFDMDLEVPTMEFGHSDLGLDLDGLEFGPATVGAFLKQSHATDPPAAFDYDMGELNNWFMHAGELGDLCPLDTSAWDIDIRSKLDSAVLPTLPGTGADSDPSTSAGPSTSANQFVSSFQTPDMPPSSTRRSTRRTAGVRVATRAPTTVTAAKEKTRKRRRHVGYLGSDEEPDAFSPKK